MLAWYRLLGPRNYWHNTAVSSAGIMTHFLLKLYSSGRGDTIINTAELAVKIAFIHKIQN